MDSAKEKVVVTLEKNFNAIMEQAKTLSKQMQFRRASQMLQRQVLKPVICEINSKSCNGFSRFINLFWRDRNSEKYVNTVTLCEILFEAFAQLIDVHLVSGVVSNID